MKADERKESRGRVPGRGRRPVGPGPEVRAPLRPILLIALIGLLLRLVYLSGMAADPLARSLELDPKLNDERAWGIAQGVNEEPSPYFRPPLYTHSLALVYRALGHSLTAARVAQALLGTATVILLGLIAWTLWGRRAALFASALAAFYGPLIFFEGQLVSATLETALIAASIWLALGTRRGSGRVSARLVLGGLFLSAAAITRPTVLPFALAAAVWLGARAGGKRIAAIYLAAVLLLPGVVTLRNGIAGKDWVFVASQGGINFYIGNDALADGTTPNVPGAGSGIAGTEEAPRRIASAALGRPLKASEVSAYWYGRGLAFWLERPGEALALFAKKVALLWNRRELPNLLDMKFFAPFDSWLFRGPWLLSFAVLAPIALVTAWVERRRAVLLLAFLGAYTLVTAAFFVCDRFRLPLAVGVIPLAAAGIDRFLSERARLRSLGHVVGTHRATAILLVFSVAVVWVPFPRLQATETGMSWYRLARAYERSGDSTRAASAYSTAERAGLDLPELFNDEGLFHLRHQDLIGAESFFRRALEKKPAYGPAHVNLAEIYYRREQWEFAAQEYEIAAGLIHERAAELYVNAGMVNAGIGRKDHARAMYESALRARPGFQPAVEGLEQLHAEDRD